MQENTEETIKNGQAAETGNISTQGDIKQKLLTRSYV